jgi:hypothetical protein
LTGQAEVCAVLTNEPAAEFACAAFNLNTPPPGCILRTTTPGSSYELVGETSDTYLPDLLLKRGQVYCYVVQAYDDSGILSPFSSEACRKLPLLDMYISLIQR